MRIVSAAQMRELDRLTIEELGLPGAVLMESAGRGAVQAIDDRFPGARRLRVLAGRGNNGGDGFVVARYFHTRGYEVRVLLFADPDGLRGEAAANRDRYRKLGGGIDVVADLGALKDLEADLAGADLLVDALLGTGLERPVEGLLAEAIEMANGAGRPIVSLDVPSGLSSDTGHPLGIAVEADVTVTFGYGKIGLVTHPGYLYAGVVEVVDIGIPDGFADRLGPTGVLLSPETARDFLPNRPPDAHKGNAGHLLVLAGSRTMTGAARMTAEAAARAGAGLVTLAVPSGIQATIAAGAGETMTAEVHGPAGHFDPAGVDAAISLARGKQAVALGPGIGREDGTRAFVEGFLRRWDGVLVLDADALNLVAEMPGVLLASPAQILVTPHPGEMARLLGATAAEVQADRVGAAVRFARDQQVGVVLKGARTVVASPDGHYAINTTGNRGMASGGMGDVLTGILGALAAQGLGLGPASFVGPCLHGLAADLAAAEAGEVGLLARDLIAALPRAIARLERGEPPADHPAH